MDPSDAMQLEKLVGRQKRPATGDVFRVRLSGGEFYFGLVVDGDMAVGPLAPGSILVVVFSGSSKSGEIADLDELPKRPLLMPPAIVNQRPWTLGYAEKLGRTDGRPEGELIFNNSALGRFYNRHGEEVAPTTSRLVGVWGVGNEQTLADKIVAAISR